MSPTITTWTGFLRRSTAATALFLAGLPVAVLGQGVRFEEPAYSVVEGAGFFQFCVLDPGGAAPGAFVQVRSRGETADASNGDYRAVNVGLPFAPGQVRACGQVDVIDDLIEEGDETFRLEIESASPGPIDPSGSSTRVTIVDDDHSGPIEVFFPDTYPPEEPGGPRRIFWPDPESWNGAPGPHFPRPVVQLTRPDSRDLAVELDHPAFLPATFAAGGVRSTFITFTGMLVADVRDLPPLQLVRPSQGLAVGQPDRVEIAVQSCIVRVFGRPAPCWVRQGDSLPEKSGAFECAYEIFDALRRLEESDSSGSVAGRPSGVGLKRATDDETLRSFRDVRMSTTRSGRYYRDLYRAYSQDLAFTLVPRASLVRQIAGAQGPWVAALDAAAGGSGDTVVTQDMVDDMLAIFDRFEQEGTEELAGVLRAERQKIDFAALPGKSIDEAIDLVYEQGGPPQCVDGETSLCLTDDRFLVDVFWKDFEGNTGEGQAIPLTDDSGGFWFFDAANVELVVKVLDATAINDHFWVFYGALSNVEYTLRITDTLTGAVRTYDNPSGAFASAGDTQALTVDGSVPVAGAQAEQGSLIQQALGAGSTLVREGWKKMRTVLGLGAGLRHSPSQHVVHGSHAARSLPQDAARAASCAPSSTALCLEGGRFRVEVAWREFGGRTGVGQARPLTEDTGTFWFFDAANVELVVKVLDGRGVNGHFWVFYGALSNVAYTLTVTDTATGETRSYENPLGEFGSAGDTEAF